MNRAHGIIAVVHVDLRPRQDLDLPVDLPVYTRRLVTGLTLVPGYVHIRQSHNTCLFTTGAVCGMPPSKDSQPSSAR